MSPGDIEAAPLEPIPPKSMQIKTDKPRPYVCPTCTRSFARLEHLKRHERSHTKEKPFQCPVCERCFARRDLLLRHKQKLHASFSPPKSDPTTAPPHPKRRASSVAAANTQGVTAKSRSKASPTGSSVSQMKSEGIQQSMAPTRTTRGRSMTAQYPPGWLPLNPLEHELDTFRTHATPTHNVSNIGSRSNSFTASSATSYVRQKDVELYMATHTPMGPQEVSFSTPQAYQLESDGLAAPEPLDLYSSFSNGTPSGNETCINPQLLTQAGNRPAAQIGSSLFGRNSDYRRLSRTDYNSPQTVDSLSYATPSMVPPSVGAWDSPLNFPSYQSSFTSNQSPNDPLNSRDPLVPTVNDEITTAEGINFKEGEKILDDFVDLDYGELEQNGQTKKSKANPCAPRSHYADPAPLYDPVVKSEPLHNAGRSHGHGHHQFEYWAEPVDRTHGFDMGTESWQSDPWNPETGSSYQTSPFSIASSNDATKPSASKDGLERKRSPSPGSIYTTQMLPSSDEVRLYVKAYHERFNPYLHFVHPSMRLSSQNMALVMAMAAIGALYSGERELSLRIYNIARDCIRMYSDINVETVSDSTTTVPLWLVQASVLAIIYGLFHNSRSDNELAVYQGQRLGKLVGRAALNMPPHVTLGALSSTATTQEKWAYFLASQKRIRTMYAVHAVAILMTTTYGLPPFASNQDLQCGVPCTGDLWEATSAEDWWAAVVRLNLQNKFLLGPNYGHCFNVLLSEQPLNETVPPELLLNLICGIHLEIAQRRAKNSLIRQSERVSSNAPHSWENDLQPYVSDAVIHAWEITWSKLEKTQGLDECIPLASLAYIRTHVDLIPAKERLWFRDFAAMNEELDRLRHTAYTALIDTAIHAIHTIEFVNASTMSGSSLFLHAVMCVVDGAFVLSEAMAVLEVSKELGQADKDVLARTQQVLDRLDASTEPLSRRVLLSVSNLLGRNTPWLYVDVVQSALHARVEHLRASS